MLIFYIIKFSSNCKCRLRFKVGAVVSICTNFEFAPFINGCPNYQFKVGAAPFINGADLKLGHNIYIKARLVQNPTDLQYSIITIIGIDYC